MWCIPEITPEYAERMEGLLDLYARPLDPDAPVICMDEKSVQLLAETRQPIPMKKPGQVLKRDGEYVRRGTANIFCAVEPKAGRHITRVTRSRKRKDFAGMLKLIESRYPGARTIHLVLDNLNTHSLKSLVESYGKVRGKRLWQRFTVHLTPKHASWLNQAEIEIGVLSRQALGKDRLPLISALRSRIMSWNRFANRAKLTIDWRFTTDKARAKFKYRVSANTLH